MNQQQLEILQVIQAMFNAAPGAAYLNEFEVYIAAGGTAAELANILTRTEVFKQYMYSDSLSDHEFAIQFVENMVGNLVSAGNKAWAVAEIEKYLVEGSSRGEIMYGAATILASVGASNADWGSAAQQFNNKVNVAAFYSIDKAGAATSLSVLQQVTANVTNLTSSVASAKAVFESGVSGKVIDGYVKGATVSPGQ